MIHINVSKNRRGRFQLAALLGTSAVLAATLWAPPMGAASPQAATPSAVTYQVGDALALDEFDRTGHSLGRALVGGRWATASPTGLLTLAGGAATWSGFTRGQTTHAWLPAVSASDQVLVASFSFGVVSRAHYGMSHRTVVRRQTNGDGYVTAGHVVVRPGVQVYQPRKSDINDWKAGVSTTVSNYTTNAKSDSGLWSVMLIDPNTGHRATKGQAGALSVWAFRDRPVYTCSLDRQPGDANCDSFGEFNGRRNGFRAFWLRDDFGNSAYSF